ncbi:MAG: alpha-amylase family glycosyl hydrolase, partial [Rhizobacter sp.]
RDARRISAGRFDALLRELREAYPACVAPVMQNLFGSHDTARLASHAVNRDRLDYRAFDEAYHPQQSRVPQFDTRAPDDHERALQRLFVLFQMTGLGAPMVYYGDEAGMWSANDPCCRQPMRWPDLYDVQAFDTQLHAHYRRCIALRAALPVLRTGSVETLLADDAREVLVHLRRDGEALAIVAINRTETPQAIAVVRPGAAHWCDRLNGDAEVDARDGTLRLTLAPLWGAVLSPQGQGKMARSC